MLVWDSDWTPPSRARLTALAVDKLPDVKTHELAVPRIAILHTWTNTQNDGWYRIEFDKFEIPYTYISDQVVRSTPNLREKYDVIIFPPLGGSAQSIVVAFPCAATDPLEAVGPDANMGYRLIKLMICVAGWDWREC